MLEAWKRETFHRRKMSTHALQKITRDLFREMSLAPRQKYPRNVEMKEAMAAFSGSDSVAISYKHCCIVKDTSHVPVTAVTF